jgi:hypothetical protein
MREPRKKKNVCSPARPLPPRTHSPGVMVSTSTPMTGRKVVMRRAVRAAKAWEANCLAAVRSIGAEVWSGAPLGLSL